MFPRIVFVSLLLVCAGLPARADVPDPAYCHVHPADELNGVVVSPQSGATVTASELSILVESVPDGHPLENAQVVVLLTPNNPVCPGAVLTGTTNHEGLCIITVAAGGCADVVQFACVIKANGITIRSYVNAKSPDWDGAQSNGLVNLGDLILFSREFNGVDPAGCHDYTNDNLCNLSDLTIFGEAFSRAVHCP